MSDEVYEYSEPVTVYGSLTADQSGGAQGGPNGVAVLSPFGGAACEWALQLVVTEGAGKVSISPNGKPPAVGVTGYDGGVAGYMFNAPAAEVIAPHPVFTPLVNGRVYVSLNITTGNASVVLLFRRHRGHLTHAGEFGEQFYAIDPEQGQTVNDRRAEAMQSQQQVASSENDGVRRRWFDR